MSLCQIDAFSRPSSHESKAIIIPDGPQLTFPELVEVVKNLQVELSSLRLPSQSFISLALVNSIEFVVSFLAITSSNHIAAPLNPAYKESEFSFYIGDVRSALVIVPFGAVSANTEAVKAARKQGAAVAETYWDAHSRRLVFDIKDGVKHSMLSGDQIPRPTRESIALVLHTSGTTGRPKAVPLTHLNLTSSMMNIWATYRWIPGQDIGYLVMPLFHVHGLLCGFLSPLLFGTTIVIPPRFSAQRFWLDFTRYRANWYTAVPTIHIILLKSAIPDPAPKLRFIRSCSSALAPATLHKLEKAFGCPVLEAYAMTEACHQMTSNSLPPDDRCPGTVGIPQGSLVIAILDEMGNKLPHEQEGEISVKGTNVTPGYLNNPKANQETFTREGFLRTGDQGKLSKNGYLTITGRIKELINRGGEKISPIEVDGALLDHSEIDEAVTFAAPSELYGQIVNAAVVLKPGSHLTQSEIQAFLAAKLSQFKIPVRIFFTKTMPKTATGKIQRRVIADVFLTQPKL